MLCRQLKNRCVYSATNTTRQMRTQLVELFTAYKASLKMVYIESPYRLLRSQFRYPGL